MTRHRTISRLRRAVKWTGVMLTILLLVAWAGSAWYAINFGGRIGGIEFFSWIAAGDWFVSCTRIKGIGNWDWITGRNNAAFRWWSFDFAVSQSSGVAIQVPLWFLALLTSVPTTLMFRTDRRRARDVRENLCPHCGYSRAGLPDDRVCPECGKPAPGSKSA